ncbi:MAG: hypothetical protein AB7U44_06295 [Sulfuricurvum sp.]|uniref:hypothetical protein n=1 Tax=Sulfuricurvum sp. TaxID=2025608 RepID=UPI00261F24D6|nr:hypothetical protein [Sulfuricurvum sp.]MDD2839482.1 hypothetical protein [Sulfuricurvum sp.]MDD3596625.1 hypothetical protein [Sulfuricurvum sp.]MDD4882990.1 hypothetical protein [Sulfuricurvum sp.]
MKLSSLLAAGILAATPLCATNSFNSELSHFGGGVVLAGAITAIADHYNPEDRARIGFYTSTIAFAIKEAITTAKDGHAAGNLLDVAAHAAGSALGATITDQYLLTPVIRNDKTEGSFFGIFVERTF